MSFITNDIIIKRWTIVKRKVHAHGGSIELIKLRVMSDESIARRQAMLCEVRFLGKESKIRRKT
ncbi:MAG: hypothetical protein J7K33_03605 [Candidatus Marinimicrobia bacterium]|nr:hypothetical protein [Candidatus Neomarinimicrobiota bacterium]